MGASIFPPIPAHSGGIDGPAWTQLLLVVLVEHTPVTSELLVGNFCGWCVGNGPIFRSVDRHDRIQPGRLTDRSVVLVVQRAAKAAGLDPAQFAAMVGAEERDMMRQTRHRSVVVARRYIRDGSLFRNNAASAAGL